MSGYHDRRDHTPSGPDRTSRRRGGCLGEPRRARARTPVKLRPPSGFLRAARARVRPASTVGRWEAYLAEVEPTQCVRARVHRFARPPVLAAADTRPLPLAVWIEGKGEAATRTRAALEAGTVPPSIVLDGPLERALEGTRSERVVLVRAGDQLARLALERLGQAATLAPDAAIITCDDDAISATGIRHSPRFRPGPSPDRWLACDDSGPLLVVHRQRAAVLLAALAGGDAWRHELALLLAGPSGEHHAHIPLLLCHRAPDAPITPPLTAAAVAGALAHWEPGATVEQAGTVRRVRRRAAASRAWRSSSACGIGPSCCRGAWLRC